MPRLLDFIASEVLEVVFDRVIEKRKEKADFRKLEARIREEHSRVARHWAERGKQQSLRGFNLTGAHLEDVDLAEANLTEASFRNAHLINIDLSAANLNDADFSRACLENVNFVRANLSKVNFSDASLRNINFEKANLRDANLLEVKEIENCIWSGVYINSQTELKQEIKTQIVES
ncbi:pentapeptide repeat-containing protein [Candidatus Leptofilum sp.]|uniref:pentapeptide repeat-containing protein n=1 Tax=Candidatus Leptofilum sp. TaxID=3241576 RepID=UPI003B5CF554